MKDITLRAKDVRNSGFRPVSLYAISYTVPLLARSLHYNFLYFQGRITVRVKKKNNNKKFYMTSDHIIVARRIYRVICMQEYICLFSSMSSRYAWWSSRMWIRVCAWEEEWPVARARRTAGWSACWTVTRAHRTASLTTTTLLLLLAGLAGWLVAWA